jgi:hypothetical protein
VVPDAAAAELNAVENYVVVLTEDLDDESEPGQRKGSMESVRMHPSTLTHTHTHTHTHSLTHSHTLTHLEGISKEQLLVLGAWGGERMVH